MPKPQKKRNKKYVPKLMCFPLGMRDDHKFEIPFLSALSTLGTPDFDEGQLYKLAEFGYIAAELNAPHEWKPWSDAVDSVWARYQKTGKFGASGDEISTFRRIGPMILTFLRDQRNYEVVRAADTVLKKLKKMRSADQNRQPQPQQEEGSDSYVPYGEHAYVG